MSRRAKSIAALLMVSGATLLSAAPASADHHFVSIREVFPGSTITGQTSEFIELQMYAPNQTNFTGNGQTLQFYNAAGMPTVGFAPGSDLSNGANQASALYATPAAEADFGNLQADFEEANSDHMDPAGGAVCFRSTPFGIIDCVAWGTFDNSPMGANGLPVGMPAAAIPDESSLVRSINPGCPTLLEGTYTGAGGVMGPDDTNVSATDFTAAAPFPRNNAGAITETACIPPTTFTPPGNPTSPINPAGNVRKRKCKKSNRAAAAKKKKCKKKKR